MLAVAVDQLLTYLGVGPAARPRGLQVFFGTQVAPKRVAAYDLGRLPEPGIRKVELSTDHRTGHGTNFVYIYGAGTGPRRRCATRRTWTVQRTAAIAQVLGIVVRHGLLLPNSCNPVGTAMKAVRAPPVGLRVRRRPG